MNPLETATELLCALGIVGLWIITWAALPA